MLENLLRFPLWVVAQSLCLFLDPQWRLLPRLGLGSCGLQEREDIWGMSSALGRKGTRYMSGQGKQKERIHFSIPRSHKLAPVWSSGSLALAGVALKFSGVIFLGTDSVPQISEHDRRLCALALSSHPFLFLPHSFLPKGSGAHVRGEYHHDLPCEANALLGIFLKWIYRIPFYEDSDGRA